MKIIYSYMINICIYIYTLLINSRGRPGDQSRWYPSRLACKFPHKMWLLCLWNVHVHFDRARLAQNGCRGNSVWQFPCKFPNKMALVKCPCAFGLRRFAWNGGRGQVVPGVSCKFPYKLALVKCPCGFRMRRVAQNVRLTSGACHLWRAAFFL